MRLSNILLVLLLLVAGHFCYAQEVALDPGPIVVPPEWLLNALDMLYSLPVLGPIVVVAVQWGGVIAMILTSLVGFLLTVLKALSKVLELAQLVKYADMIKKFEASKVMYWLRAFSNIPPKKKLDVKP